MKKVFLLLFSLSFAYQILITSGHIYTYDGEVIFQTAKSIVENHSTDIKPDKNIILYSKKGKDGKWYSKFGIGSSLFLVPFIVFGKLMSYIFGISGKYSVNMLYFIVSFSNGLVISLIVGVFYLLCYSITKQNRTSIIISLFLGFASFLAPYGRTLFNDPLTCLNLTLSVYFYFKYTENEKLKYILYAGVFSGFMIATRIEYGLALSGVALLFLNYFRLRKKNPLLIMNYLIPIGAIIGLLLFYNYSRFGSFIDTGVINNDPTDKFSTPLFMGMFGMFFSPGKGLIYYAPIILLSLYSLPKWLSRQRQDAFIMMFFIILPMLILHSMWHSWMGGWSWGPRRTIGIITILLLPAIEYINDSYGHHNKKKKIFLWILFIAGFLIQIPGMLVNFMSYIKWAPSFYNTIYTLSWAPYIGHIKYYISGGKIDLYWIYMMQRGIVFPALFVIFSCVFIMILLLLKLKKQLTGKN